MQTIIKHKIIFFLFVMLSLSIPQITSAQSIKGAFILGCNLSQVNGDEVYGFKKIGLNIGASAIMPLRKSNFSVILETIFSQKGAYEKYPPGTFIATPYYKLRLDYTEIPILISYNDNDKVDAGIGLSWSRLVGGKEIEHGSEIDWLSNGIPYSNDDFNFLADVRFRVYGRFHLNFRYAYSLKKIRTRTYTDFYGNDWDRKQYNNIFTVRLVYIFNEKVPERTRKDD